MAFERSCPGSRSVKEARPTYVSCKRCGAELEVWSDEARVTCPNCLTVHFNEQNLSCIEWCTMAKECVGEEVYNRLMGDRTKTEAPERDKQIAAARARLRELIEGKECKIGGELFSA